MLKLFSILQLHLNSPTHIVILVIHRQLYFLLPVSNFMVFLIFFLVEVDVDLD